MIILNETIVLLPVFTFSLFIDINECEVNTDSCEQLCVNTDGSFECLCEPGFRQRPDNFSACDGKVFVYE